MKPHNVFQKYWGAEERTAVTFISFLKVIYFQFQWDRITFQQFLLAVPHNVDVLYADELKFDIGVVVFILVTFSCSSVCDCV